MSDLLVSAVCGAVEGTRTNHGGRLFAGIPFALPPVGDLRLRPPVPAPAWTKVLHAHTFGSAPVQEGPNGHVVGDENCLTLNIWTPSTAGPHPVLVWLYGGGFEHGSASPPGTDAAGLAERLQAVVVTPNYRVGALGWLHLADIGGTNWAGSTNLGLQDQLLALRWVRTNIGAFGGSPERVTLGGLSAGAFSVGTMLAVPAAHGLFQRALLHSGGTGRVYSREVASTIATDLLRCLAIAEPSGLQRVPVPALLEAQKAVIDHDIGRRNLPGGRAWGVVLDGNIVPVDPQTAVAAGVARHKPLLLNATRDEAQLFELMAGPGFAPKDDGELIQEMTRVGFGHAASVLAAYRRTYPHDDLTRLRTRFLSDAIYRRPLSLLAEAQVRTGGRAYTSLLTAAPFGDALGACHASDYPLLFDRVDATGEFPAIPSQFDDLRKDMTAAWRRFIHDGDPGWPPYATSEATTRQFGLEGGLIREPPAEIDLAWRF